MRSTGPSGTAAIRIGASLSAMIGGWPNPDDAPAARLPGPAGPDRRASAASSPGRAQHRRRRPALERRGALLHADGLRRRPGRRARRVAPRFAGSREPLRDGLRFAESSKRKRVAIMVSREDHCLSDLLWRWRSGELGAEVAAVDLQPPRPPRPGRGARPPLPPRPGRAGDQGGGGAADPGPARRDRPARPRPLHADPLRGLPARLDAPAINIHHSFLPAFVGADPYRRAHERGVKLIGATAHYVTAELDAGPIIAQDVTRVSHRDEVAT